MIYIVRFLDHLEVKATISRLDIDALEHMIIDLIDHDKIRVYLDPTILAQ